MSRSIVFILMSVLLLGCAPATKEAETPTQTATVPATSTAAPTFTPIPTKDPIAPEIVTIVAIPLESNNGIVLIIQDMFDWEIKKPLILVDCITEPRPGMTSLSSIVPPILSLNNISIVIVLEFPGGGYRHTITLKDLDTSGGRIHNGDRSRTRDLIKFANLLFKDLSRCL